MSVIILLATAGGRRWSPRRARRLCGIALLLTVAGLSEARGNEIYLEPQMQVEGLASDNVTLNRTKKEQDLGGILSPQMKLGYAGPDFNLGWTNAIAFNGYVPSTDLSSIDERSVFQGILTRERSQYGLDAEFNRYTVLDNFEDNTGLFVKAVRVTRLSALPSWAYALTELDQLNFNAGYLHQAYTGGDNSLVDYGFATASAGWSHRWSETDRMTATLNYGRYIPESGLSSDADIVSAELGWAHVFSEKLHIEASAGPSVTRTYDNDQGSGAGTNLGYAADLHVNYQMNDALALDAYYTRRSEPSGSGGTRERDRAGVTVSYKATRDTTLRLAGSYTGNETGGGNSSNSTDDFRRYLRFEPSVTWQIREDLDLAFSYRFQMQSFRGTSDQAIANSVFLTLTWRGDRLSWSD